MKILIDLYTIVNDTKCLQSGYFKVNNRKFKEDPDKSAARLAYEWLQQVRKESAYAVEIWLIKYNDNDITEIVKEMDEAPLE